MTGRRDGERDRRGSRLARTYLKTRASQWQERQPQEPAPGGTIRLPRLDIVQLGSPEIEAQLRLLALARVRVRAAREGWFVLANGSAWTGDTRTF